MAEELIREGAADEPVGYFGERPGEVWPPPPVGVDEGPYRVRIGATTIIRSQHVVRVRTLTPIILCCCSCVLSLIGAMQGVNGTAEHLARWAHLPALIPFVRFTDRHYTAINFWGFLFPMYGWFAVTGWGGSVDIEVDLEKKVVRVPGRSFKKETYALADTDIYLRRRLLSRVVRLGLPGRARTIGFVWRDRDAVVLLETIHRAIGIRIRSGSPSSS